MYKKIVITIVLLSSLSFFDLVFVPDVIARMFELAAPLFMLTIIFVHGVYDSSVRIKKKFSTEIILISVSVILSMIGAYAFHNQSIAITATTQRFIYFLLFYPFLHALKPTPQELTKLIIYTGIVYALIYILQTLAYPAELIRSKILFDRGTLRMALPGSGFLVLTYFISVTYFIKTYNSKSLFLLLLSIAVIVLLGTRQVLAPVALMTLLSILFSKKVKSRALSVIIILLMVIPVYYLFIQTFEAMFEMSNKQAANITEDIRYKSAMFYLFEFFPNKLSYLIGNGVSSSLSPFGKKIESFNEVLGYYQADIGIIGEYSKFGLLFVIAELSIYLRIVFTRLPDKLDFVKLSVLTSLLTILVGSSFSHADFIVLTCILLYLTDTSFFYDLPEGQPAFQPKPINS